jgi:hypothetical protein
MADQGTTSIDSLPIGVEENITLQTTEKNIIVDNKVKQLEEQRAAEVQSKVPVPPEMNMNEFVSGIQQASASGALGLQHRDVPLDKAGVTRDETVKPGFIPSVTQTDYITEHQTSEEIIRQNAKKQAAESNTERIISELGIPLLIAALYFMYQLPIVRRTFFKTLPMCYNKTGDLNLTGYLVNSLVFGFIIFTSHKAVQYLSN